MHGCFLHAVGVLEEEIGLVERAFFACTVDADDAGGGGRGELGEEVLDEARADVVPEG